MDTVTLYHGTSQENYNAIIQSGIILGRAYFTARRDIAVEYGECVVVANVDISKIEIDWESTDYDCDMTVEQAIDEGISVYVDEDVKI